jgi:HSP20 family molecular chaperone IbpA
MAKISVDTCRDAAELPEYVGEAMQALAKTVRERAFELFQGRGGANGDDLSDWLQAERDVTWSPEVEWAENSRNLSIRIATPGFSEKDLKVIAMPDGLIVEAEKANGRNGKRGKVQSAELSGKKLIRKLEWSSPVNVEKVTAILEDGILLVNAPKAKTMSVSA